MEPSSQCAVFSINLAHANRVQQLVFQFRFTRLSARFLAFLFFMRTDSSSSRSALGILRQMEPLRSATIIQYITFQSRQKLCK